MFLDIDLLTVGQATFHLLGEDGGGGKAANELQASFAALRLAPLIAQNCGSDIPISASDN